MGFKSRLQGQARQKSQQIFFVFLGRLVARIFKSVTHLFPPLLSPQGPCGSSWAVGAEELFQQISPKAYKFGGNFENSIINDPQKVGPHAHARTQRAQHNTVMVATVTCSVRPTSAAVPGDSPTTDPDRPSPLASLAAVCVGSASSAARLSSGRRCLPHGCRWPSDSSAALWIFQLACNAFCCLFPLFRLFIPYNPGVLGSIPRWGTA